MFGCVIARVRMSSIFTCMCEFSRSQGTYRLLNAVGPFQCCITIELRLSSDIDDIITVLVLQLKLLWFDFLAISSLLLFFSDLPMAHKRFRNRNDDTIRPDAMIIPHAMIAIGSTVFSVDRGKIVVSDVLFVPFNISPSAVCVSLLVFSLLSTLNGISLVAVVPFPFGFGVSFDLCCWSVELFAPLSLCPDDDAGSGSGYASVRGG